MARLIVAACSEDAVAAPGNRQPDTIIVSVTNADGVPVSGLGVTAFAVDPMVAKPNGALVSIAGITPGRLPGFYLINVVPIRRESWKAGVYIFAIAVQVGADHGQTLATVLMD